MFQEDGYQSDPTEAGVPGSNYWEGVRSVRTNAPLVVSNMLASNLASIPEIEPRILLIRAGTGIKFEDCGKIAFAVACRSKCSPPRYVPHSCNRLQCPVDYELASVLEARKAELRLLGLATLYRRAGKDVRQLRHIVWSVPKDYTTARKLVKDCGKAFRKEFHKMLEEASEGTFYGGIEVFHPWRLQHLDGTPCEDPDCKRAHTWLWGPHFHYVGYGRFEDSEKFEARTGWLYHVVKEKGKRDRSAFGTIQYLLTHCGLFVNVDDPKYAQVNQALRWVGQWSNAKGGKKILKKTKTYELCEKCKQNLAKYLVDSDGKIDNYMFDEGDFYTVVEEIEWYLTVPKSRAEKLLREQDTLEEYAERWRRRLS